MTRAEELASALTHGVGAVAAVALASYLLVRAVGADSAVYVVGLGLFGAGLVLTYISSTVFHSVRRPLARFVWELIDHSAIFVLIAGTYSPFALIAIGGAWGWTIFALIWVLAAIGIGVRLAMYRRDGRGVVPIHLGMGWLSIAVLPSLWIALGPLGIALILLGGVFYTVGVPFFLADRLPYNHALWHVFCIKGSACHAAAVLVYCLP